MEFNAWDKAIQKSFASGLLTSLILIMAMSPGIMEAEAAPLDGITIIAFDDPGAQRDIASGNHLVTYISAMGSFAAVVTDPVGQRSICTSLAVPDSYTGTSIAFGMDADAAVRRQRNDVYCPSFTLLMDGENKVRVKTGDRLSTLMDIVIHIPFTAIDYNGDHFHRHNLKGVKLGPLLDQSDLNPNIAGEMFGPRYRVFQHAFEQQDGKKNVVRGKAAISEVTGWPVDVLYVADFTETLPTPSPFEAFYGAVIEKYGEPSSRYKDTGYMLWFYDLAGQKIDLKTPMSNACRNTLVYRLTTDPHGQVYKLQRRSSEHLDFWGCSLVMELNGNPSGGAVSAYRVVAYSPYAMAIDHFHQKIAETEELKKKIDALLERKPQF